MKSLLKNAKLRAWSVFSEYIKYRDCYETTGHPFSCICFTCGREIEFNKHLHASHFILDSKNGNSTSFDDHNVHACCDYCNRFKNGNLGNYAIHLIEKYGKDEVDRLQRLKLITKKWTIDELNEIHDKYKELIKKYK